MTKRLFWLTVGCALGVLLTVRTTRTMQRAVERWLPPPVAERLLAINSALDQRAAEIRARKRQLRSVS